MARISEMGPGRRLRRPKEVLFFIDGETFLLGGGDSREDFDVMSTHLLDNIQRLSEDFRGRKTINELIIRRS